LAHLASKYRVTECFADLDDLIAARPDAVMVHTATESHASIVKALLEQRIPVFVDKPISYQLHECEALLELAARQGVALTVGFNRRFAPLIQPLGDSQSLVQVRMQKNRTHWPADPRVFLYDDFIHVVDTLRFIASGETSKLEVFAHGRPGHLEAVQVQWQRGKSLLTGSMNRVSGLTEERLEVFTRDHKWQVDNLAQGGYFAYQDAKSQYLPLGFKDWDDTLYKRGFVSMFAAFLQQLQAGNASDYEDILATHSLCEQLVQRVEQQLQVSSL
jgi:virulence factor